MGTVDLQSMAYFTKAEGLGTPVKILHEATIPYIGWEMDNYGWIVEMNTGTIVTITTSHGGWRVWLKEDAVANVSELKDCVESINKALEMWPSEAKL